MKPMSVFCLFKNLFYKIESAFKMLFASIRVIAFYLPIAIVSCDSENDPPAQIDYISSDEEAKLVFRALYYFWDYSAKSSMPHQTVWPDQALGVDHDLTDNFGTAHFTGSIKFSADGSSDTYSSWSYHSIIIDVTSTLSKDFTLDFITFNGSLKFNDIDAYSDVCTYCFTCIPSGMQCSGGANISQSINTVNSLYVEFESNGKKIKDIITIQAKYENASWDINIKNKEGHDFKLSSLW